MSKRIIPLFLSVVILFSAFSPIPASADYTNSYENVSYWEGVLIRGVKGTSGTDWGGLIQGLAGKLCGDICRTSDDTLHHADSIKGCKTGSDDKGMYALAKCKYCGQSFKYYSDDLKRQYNDAVTSRGGGFGRVTRGGGFSVSPNHSYSAISIYSNYRFPYWYCSHSTSTPKLSSDIGSLVCSAPTTTFRATSSSGCRSDELAIQYTFTCAVDGTYSWASGYVASGSAITSSGSSLPMNVLTGSSFHQGSVKYAGDVVTFTVYGRFTDSTIVRATLNAPEPELRVTPLESIEKDYPKTSRPGIINGDFTYTVNNTTNKVENTTIVDETNNTFYNPVTNTTTNMNDWVFDYSDRSYTITTDNSTTTTVTYGDEYITIREGDTIYNIYYYVAQDQNPDQDTGCKHSYTSTVTTAATCEAPGLMTYTCSKCGDTYTEKIPATGHTWQVKQTVKTEYDEAGNVTQQGYTVYKCAICGTEYKDDAGTGPPSTPDNGDSGSGGIWDKLGNLLGSVVAGILSLIEAVFGKLLDSMISLAEMIAGKLKQVVELVLSFFDEIPTLFGGFLGFLSAVFPFIPDDIMLLLTFGIAAVVFISIIKALRR